MENKRLIRSLITIFIVLVTVFTAMSISASAASKTVKMKVYDVIKVKNTVYCGTQSGLFKVKLKKGKVKSVKRLYKAIDVGELKKKGKWLYFASGSNGNGLFLHRINLKTNKRQQIASLEGFVGYFHYVIKDKKIFYLEESIYDMNKMISKVMKINGKSRKRTKVKAKTIFRKSNKKGFSIIEREKGQYYISYLKTPKGKFRLGKINYDFWL